MKIMITGSRGYVGSHLAKKLKQHTVVDGADVRNRVSLLERMDGVEAVIHCAAIANIPDSISDPQACYQVNVGGTINVIEAMRDAGVSKLIFPSTNTVNGDHPYARSKKMGEQIVRDSGLKYAILRYFNVAGTSIKGKWKDNYRLIPRLLSAAHTGKPFTLYGGGVQVRDYIHIEDACLATINALVGLDVNPSMEGEIGAGIGYSIEEVIFIARKVTGKKINVIEAGERKGDVSVLISSSPCPVAYSLEDIIQSAWDNYEAV